jgi:ABC-type amino acid transport substrate-binding protein
MKKLILLIVLLIAAYAGWHFTQKPAGAVASTLDRVQQSKIIRCSYMIWEPYLKKDITTGKVSGIAVDYLNILAEKNGLKIDWAEEVPIDQLATNLLSGRTDMFCVPCSAHPDYEKVMDFVGSFGHLPYYTYVPAQSQITEEGLKTAHFTVIDGYIPSVETAKAYPNAKVTSLPMMTSMAELYDQLKYNKADALVNEHISALTYMKNNPGVIRRFSDKPVVLKDMSFPIKEADGPWLAFVNEMTTMKNPENRALLQKLMVEYNLTDGALLPE